MNRRQVLRVAGGLGVALAGCLDQSTVPATSTESPTSSRSVESRVEVPPCPEKPGSTTQDTILQFAIQFEKAYVTRQTLRDLNRIVSINIDIGDELTDRTATQTDDGWVARFTVVGPAYRYRPTPGSTETAHVDPSMYVANYFVTEQVVRRAQATEAVDPRENGTLVQCPPE